MKMKLKKTVINILCLVLSLVIYLYLCVIVTPKDINDAGGALYYNGMGFLAEPENSLDIMVYGNSDVYSGFAPAVIFEKQGYTSYASGRARQTVGNIYPLLKKTLKTQSPSLVILEVDCLFEEEGQSANQADLLYAPFVYHSRWKELKARDFYTFPDRAGSVDINKGYINSNRIYNTNINEAYMGDKNTAPAQLTQDNQKDLREFLSVCKANEITVFFLELPNVNSWNYAKHNAVAKIAEEEGIHFLDLNAKPEGYQLDTKQDFRDNGDHLNRKGAYKTSSYIADFLKEQYGDILENRKDNPAYAQWQQVVEHYKKEL